MSHVVRVRGVRILVAIPLDCRLSLLVGANRGIELLVWDRELRCEPIQDDGIDSMVAQASGSTTIRATAATALLITIVRSSAVQHGMHVRINLHVSRPDQGRANIGSTGVDVFG